MNCSHCGFTLPASATRCPRCADHHVERRRARSADPAATAAAALPRTRRPWWMLAGAMLAIMVAFTAWWWARNAPYSSEGSPAGGPAASAAMDQQRAEALVGPKNATAVTSVQTTLPAPLPEPGAAKYRAGTTAPRAPSMSVAAAPPALESTTESDANTAQVVTGPTAALPSATRATPVSTVNAATAAARAPSLSDLLD